MVRLLNLVIDIVHKTGGTHFLRRCQEVAHRTGRDIIIHLQISRPSGGGGGFRTLATLSRPTGFQDRTLKPLEYTSKYHTVVVSII